MRVIHSGLVLLLWLGFASAAGAGPAVIPHGTEICGNTEVAEDLPDPNIAYSAVEPRALCEKVCKKTEADCRENVKSAWACMIRTIRFSHEVTKISCTSQYDGDEERACKENSEEFWLDTLPYTKQQRALHLDDCADWGAVCRANSCD